MSAKSIDGLQRRSTIQKTNGKKIVVRHTSAVQAKKPTVKKIAVSSPKKKRSLEVPDKKKDLKELIAENDALEAETAKEELKARKDEAVKEFLEEVQDSDPTDLAELPKKEKMKEKPEKKKKEKKPKKHKVLKRVLLILFLLILLGGAGAYLYLNDFVAKITDGGNLLGFLFSDPDTPLKKDDQGRTNIIIFGTEGWNMDDPNYDGGFLTDSMMLLSVNQDTGDAKAVSLPRDLKANYTCTGTGKINEVYFCEYSKNDGSEASRKEYETRAANKLGEAFTEVLGVDVHYHIHANWAAVTRIVDAIGGIDVVFTSEGQTWEGEETVIETTSKKGLRDVNSHGKTYLDYPNGQPIHLDGGQALAVARVRNAYGGYGASNGNFNREVFQQRILEAIVKKAKSKNLTGDLVAVMQIKDAIGDNLRTDFKDDEIKSVLKIASNVDFTNLETISLYSTDDKPAALLRTGMINNISYVIPTAGVGNYANIKSYMKRKLSAEAFTSENAQITVLNGTSAYGVASKEKTELENNGYIVNSSANAPADQSGFDGVRVYQKNDKMPQTAEALKKFYGVDIITEIPESLKNTAADFIVIIGNGFSHK
ncbi:LCP family protein [Candidatus Saccharibacteria bacterium]|nr:LCP family protein [Candidatus Saccharibacteria bacterium]MBR3378512.1 LCP family protein [Candidatus Saccharibacteria bacterium]